MIFDNGKLAFIFVILFLLIVVSAFFVLRSRISSQTSVAQTEVATISTTPNVQSTPQVVNPSVSPTVSASGGTVGTGTTHATASATNNSNLPRTGFMTLLGGLVAGLVALSGFHLRKFPKIG